MIVAFALTLTAATLFAVFFVRRQDIPEPLPVSPIQHLEDRKQAIYDNLRDLQFEYRLGKLSDGDYRETKLALQRELAVVLSEMEGTINRLGLQPKRVPAKSTSKKPSGTTCPSCGASFQQALKYCGQCGKAIA